MQRRPRGGKQAEVKDLKARLLERMPPSERAILVWMDSAGQYGCAWYGLTAEQARTTLMQVHDDVHEQPTASRLQ